jgi:uncharacterized Tic20 family protein
MQPTEDERVLAALSHAGIIANVAGMSGLVGAALIWATQRGQSAYVRTQALQALAYQGCALLVGVLLVALWGSCLGLALLPAALFPDLYHTSPPPLFWPALYSAVLPLIYGALVVGYGLYAAAQALQGRPFHYPLIGRVGAASAAGAPATLPDVPAAPTAVPPAAEAAAAPAPAPPEDLSEADQPPAGPKEPSE